MRIIISLSFFVCFNLNLFLGFVVGVELSSGESFKLDSGAVKTLSDHKENIIAIAISPDGKLLASGGVDRFVILCEIASGKELWRMQFRGVVSSLAFTPDGKFLAAGCRDKNLIICDVKTGKESARFQTFTKYITAIKISPNGKYIAVGFENGVTLLFDLATKKLHKELSKVHSTSIWDIAFSGKSDCVLVASHDASTSIWSVGDGKWLYTFKGHRGPVKSVSFDYRNEKIISSSTDRSIIVWQRPTNSKQDSKELILKRLTGHTAEVLFVRFAPDAETAYSASLDKTFAQWNLSDGKRIVSVDAGQVMNRVAVSPSTAYHVIFSSGKRVSAIESSKLKFVAPKYPAPSSKNPFPNLPFVDRPFVRFNNYESKTGAIAANFSNANLTTTATNSTATNSTNSTSSSSDFGAFKFKGNKCAFFVDPNFVVSAGADGAGVVWNISTGRVEYSFSHGSPFTSIAFSPVSAVIAAGTRDGSIIMLHPKTGKVLTAFKGHTAAVLDLSFSLNGKRLLSAGEDRLFITWNMDTGQSEGVAIGHKSKVTGIAILPDMSKAITCSADKTIRIWDNPNKSDVWNESKPEAKRSEFVSMAMESGGGWFAAGCVNKKIEVWKIGEKKELATLSGLSDIPLALAISPDGKYLLSGGADGVIVVWNTKTWKPQKTFVQLPQKLEMLIRESKKGWVKNMPQSIKYEPIVSIKFSKDGKKFLSSGGENTYIWNADAF
ncbi:MAG: WD40 repeat domain-containing protein [Planctomycetaceae bacterium]|jgi:WD40 repeat protein|nr:WD40 repeat domain-containing protein [Planctomycetaceae bacterium]